MIKKIYNKHKQIINYLIVGGLTTVISYVTYILCTITIFNPQNPFLLQCANVISWVFAVIAAYFMNRNFVFQSNKENKGKEFVKFVLSRIGTLLIDMFCMFIFVSCLSINDKIAKLIVQVIVTILNYIFSKYIVFQNKKDSRH